MYKAVIFDLDGTLADTIESIAMACNKALQACGMNPREIAEYNYYAGDGADTLVRRALAAAGDKEGTCFEKAMKEYSVFFEEDCMYNVTVFEGIKSVLDKLKQNGIKIAVLTNKPHARAVNVVDSLFGAGYFDEVLGEQKGRNKKPHPEGAFMIAEKFGFSPSECIYVGDTDVDMQTGNEAGMYTVGVLWGFRDREELERYNAHKVIGEPGEILEIAGLLGEGSKF